MKAWGMVCVIAWAMTAQTGHGLSAGGPLPRGCTPQHLADLVCHPMPPPPLIDGWTWYPGFGGTLSETTIITLSVDILEHARCTAMRFDGRRRVLPAPRRLPNQPIYPAATQKRMLQRDPLARGYVNARWRWRYWRPGRDQERWDAYVLVRCTLGKRVEVLRTAP